MVRYFVELKEGANWYFVDSYQCISDARMVVIKFQKARILCRETIVKERIVK